MCQSLRVGCMDIFVLLVDEGAVPAVCVEKEGMSMNVSLLSANEGDNETKRQREAEIHRDTSATGTTAATRTCRRRRCA